MSDSHDPTAARLTWATLQLIVALALGLLLLWQWLH